MVLPIIIVSLRQSSTQDSTHALLRQNYIYVIHTLVRNFNRTVSFKLAKLRNVVDVMYKFNMLKLIYLKMV